jgi:CRP/FNR family cyclic AMP-dependent transcriptional regulator
MADTSDFELRLNRVPIFGQLSRRQLKKLLSKAKTTSHSAGQDVTEQDKGSLAFHLVLSGSADVTVHGKKVRTIGPGEYFGEISMIDGRPRSATVTAASPLSTLAVPHLAFQGLLDDEPEVARQLLVRLCDRLREAEAD